MSFKKIITILVSLLLVVVLPLTSFASSRNINPPGLSIAPGQQKKQDNDKNINVNKSVKHGEVLTEILKAMGYEGKDYVNEAVSRGILLSSEANKFNANKEIDRQDTYKYFSRAIGAAPAVSFDITKFTDFREIAQDAVEYIQAMVNSGLFREHFNLKLIQPKKSMKWGEFTVALARFKEYIKDRQNHGEVVGLVTAVDTKNKKITIQRENNSSIIYEFAKDAKIYREGKAVNLDKIVIGDKVKAYLTDGKISYISVTHPYVEDNQVFVEGTIKSIDVTNRKFILDLGNNRSKTYQLTSDAKIYRKDKLVTLDKLVAGDKIKGFLVDSKIVYLLVVEAYVEPTEVFVEGNIKSIDITNKKVTIDLGSNVNKVYQLTSDVKIFRNSQLVTLDKLVVGDKIKGYLVDGKIAHLVVVVAHTQPVETFVDGSIKALDISNKRVTIDLASNISKIYQLASDVKIFRNNELVTLDKLIVGDKVNAYLVDGKITHLVVVIPNNVPVETYIEGKITAINTTTKRITIDKGNNSTSVYQLADDIKVYKNNTIIPLSQLKVRDEVSVYLTNSKVSFIFVTKEAVEFENIIEFEGTFVELTQNRSKIKVRYDGNSTVEFTLGQNIVVIRDGKLVNITELVAADKLMMLFDQGKVIYILVQELAQDPNQLTFADGIVRAINSQSRTLSIQLGNEIKTYTLTNESKIYSKGTSVNFSAIALGNNLKVAINNGNVAYVIIKTTEEYSFRGTVKSLDLANMKLELKEGSINSLRHFDIINFAVIKIGVNTLDISNLRPDMQLVLTIKDEEVRTLTAWDNTKLEIGKIEHVLADRYILFSSIDAINVYKVKENVEVLVLNQIKGYTDIKENMTGYLILVDDEVSRIVITSLN